MSLPEIGEWVHVPSWGDSFGLCMARVREVGAGIVWFDRIAWEDLVEDYPTTVGIYAGVERLGAE